MKKVYACYLKDENELLKSSSGGAFTAISNVVLNQGGLVIGCTYDYSIHELGFSQAGNYNARNEMRGSKYIQANPLNVYRILEELRESKETSPLLIIGTPCQIAGIKSWINLKKPNLNKSIIYCDILCHGVSSPWIWKNYIKKRKKRMRTW